MSSPGPDREVSDKAVLEAIDSIYGPAVAASEVADKIGVSRQAADNYLRRLEEDGLVETRIIGNSRAWWLSSDGEKKLKSGD